MNRLVEFMGECLSVGMKREYVLERGYEFALAQAVSMEREGAPVSWEMMAWAIGQVSDALPEAYRIYYVHTMDKEKIP